MSRLEVGSGRVNLHDTDGRVIPFGYGLGSYYPNHHAHLQLGTITGGYRVTDPFTLTRRDFDTSGKLTSITNRDGLTHTLTYAAGRLDTVTDPHGRSLTFAYDVNGRLDTVTASPGGAVVDYTVDHVNARLTGVTDPSGETWGYGYTDPVDPNLVTAITDPLGHLVEGHTYDASGRVTDFTRAENVGKLHLVYSSTETVVTSYHSPDLLDFATSTYGYDPARKVVTSISGPACKCTSGDESRTFTWNTWLDPLTETDGEGRVTRFEYYTFTGGEPPGTASTYTLGTVSAKTEAYGTPLARTTTYHYEGGDTGYQRTQVVRPSVAKPGGTTTVDLTLDSSSKRVLTEGVTGWLDATTQQTRITAYTYAFGQVATVNGPRVDVGDASTTTFYAADATRVEDRGLPQTHTDPVGNVTTYELYDVWGHPTRVTDPNGVVSTSTYDGWGRMTESRVLGPPDLVTTYHRDAAGRVEWVELPKGNVQATTYDDANRATHVEHKTSPSPTDHGDRLYREYDLRSLVTHEERQQWDGAAYQTRWQADHLYDTYGRLETTTAFDATETTWTYHGDGQVATMSDPHSHATGIMPLATYAYDELARLETVAQRLGAATTLTTSYLYDAHDNLTTVTDAEGNVTTYGLDDFGQTRTVTSSVTGVTTTAFDLSGNATTTTTAAGRQQVRSFDAASRLTAETSSLLGFTESALWLYDDTAAGNLGRGRLTGMVHGRDGGKDTATFYRYDRRGLVTRETQLIADTTYQVDHAYDDNGNQTGLTLGFLDALALTFAYGASDRASAVTATASFGTATLASDIEHEPFGPVRSYGNGGSDVVTRTYDQAFHLTGLAVGPDGGPVVLDRTYTWADGENLTSWSGGARTIPASYDNLSRLTAFNDSAGDDFGYTLDDIGNRLGETVTGTAAAAWTYRYEANGAAGNTPLLLDLADSVSGDYLPAVHDDDGNLTFLGKGGLMLGYSPAQRLGWQAEGGVGRRMTYDTRGYLVRLESDDPASELSDLRLIYDHRGRLLALMHDAAHASLDRAYAWLEDQPLAEIVPSFTPPVWWVVCDHLGTPAVQYASSTRYAEPWYEPHGEVTAKLETGGASPPLDLRFPGQLDLSLPGDDWTMHYNVHRWYLAGVGAFTQSDPLGDTILSTIETQAPSEDNERFSLLSYAGGNPLVFVDPLGLLRFKGCSPDQQQAISNAMKGACDRVETPEFSLCMCDKPRIPSKLKGLCKDPALTVRCKPAGSRGCEGNCGYSFVFGRTIRLCSGGWDKSRCGPLGCVLMHEMTHQAGYYRESWPRTTEKCLDMACKY